MTSVIAELSAHADSDEVDTEADYWQKRADVHTQLVQAIIDGDVEATAAAVALHA